jgi:hypothetical protein
MSKKRTGEVVHIRLDPQDCMAVADMMRVTGQYIPRMTLGVAVSTLFRAQIDVWRREGRIPIRDGFDYFDVMKPFGLSSRGNKSLMAEQLSIGREVHNATPCISKDAYEAICAKMSRHEDITAQEQEELCVYQAKIL